jgi:hypothetical protein
MVEHGDLEMYTGTIEDELIAACERMGYGVDLNYLRGRVEINTGTASRADRHVFQNATAALMWVEARERSLKELWK